jgi:hypothetical protein
MAIQTIRRSAVTRRTQDATRDLSWSLQTVLDADTVIAAFESPYEASAAVTKALLLPGARVWQRTGIEAATVLRDQWRARPLLSRLLGVSDEERVVEQMSADLAMGRSVVVIRTSETKQALGLLASAARMVRMGRWTFEFIR